MQSCHGAGENFEYKTSGFITAFRETSSVCCPARCTEDEISHKTRCSKIFPLPYTKWATTHIPLCLHLSVFQLFYYAICVFVESNYIYALPSTKKEAAGKSWQSWLKSPFCPSVEQQQTSDKKRKSICLGRFFTNLIPPSFLLFIFLT